MPTDVLMRFNWAGRLSCHLINICQRLSLQTVFYTAIKKSHFNLCLLQRHNENAIQIERLTGWRIPWRTVSVCDNFMNYSLIIFRYIILCCCWAPLDSLCKFCKEVSANCQQTKLSVKIFSFNERELIGWQVESLMWTLANFRSLHKIHAIKSMHAFGSMGGWSYEVTLSLPQISYFMNRVLKSVFIGQISKKAHGSCAVSLECT